MLGCLRDQLSWCFTFAPQAYSGQIAKDVDHAALMPAAWRLDRYLDADVDDDEDISMVSLRGHRLEYDKSVMRDDMARNDNIDDLKVIPRCRRAPLLDVHSELHVQTLLMGDALSYVRCKCSPSWLGPSATFGKTSLRILWIN